LLLLCCVFRDLHSTFQRRYLPLGLSYEDEETCGALGHRSSVGQNGANWKAEPEVRLSWLGVLFSPGQEHYPESREQRSRVSCFAPKAFPFGGESRT